MGNNRNLEFEIAAAAISSVDTCNRSTDLRRKELWELARKIQEEGYQNWSSSQKYQAMYPSTAGAAGLLSLVASAALATQSPQLSAALAKTPEFFSSAANSLTKLSDGKITSISGGVRAQESLKDAQQREKESYESSAANISNAAMQALKTLSQ